MMQVSSIRVENGNVILNGTIMGAMPIQALLTGTEMRKGWGMVSLGTMWQILRVFMRGKGA